MAFRRRLFSHNPFYDLYNSGKSIGLPPAYRLPVEALRAPEFGSGCPHTCTQAPAAPPAALKRRRPASTRCSLPPHSAVCCCGAAARSAAASAVPSATTAYAKTPKPFALTAKVGRCKTPSAARAGELRCTFKQNQRGQITDARALYGLLRIGNRFQNRGAL